VPSDQHAAEGHSDNDIYLFAFLPGLIAASQEDLKRVIAASQPHYLIHTMPESWRRPAQWNSLGALVLKSESELDQIVEIGGQEAGRAMRSQRVELPRRRRVKVDEGFASLAYIHIQSFPEARIGIHSPALKDTQIIHPHDWGNIWVYGLDILLAGYLTRGEFDRQASQINPGARVFQYDRTRTKNLAVSVGDLKPLADLFERVKEWNR
jgi:hypothetical protein